MLSVTEGKLYLENTPDDVTDALKVYPAWAQILKISSK